MQKNAQPLDIKRYIAIILRRKYIALSVRACSTFDLYVGKFFLAQDLRVKFYSTY